MPDVRVDSFAFLPRSFRALYADVPPFPGEEHPVWAPFEPRLADARIALLTSAGLHVEGHQAPFDAERERQEPTWGDPTWRAIPSDVAPGALGMTHLHVNDADVRADHNVALPTAVLGQLVADGVVGSATPRHASVMGYQEAGLEVWRATTGPEIAAMLREDGADGVVLAPV